jgi:hypothetical protein
MAKGRAKNFRNVIICDDVRQEINHKQTIIGAYSGDIVVANFPVALRLALYAEYVPDTVGETTINLRFMFGKVEAAQIQGSFNFQSAGSVVSMALPGLNINIPEENTLKVEASVDDAHWVPIIKKRVIRGNVQDLIIPPLS